MTPTTIKPKTVIRSTVSSKGQITLPKAVRDHLHATQGTQLEFVLEGDGVTVRNSNTEADPWLQWLGAAKLPAGETVEDFMNDIRDQDGRGRVPNPPRQRIIYLTAGSAGTSKHEDQH